MHMKLESSTENIFFTRILHKNKVFPGKTSAYGYPDSLYGYPDSVYGQPLWISGTP